MRKSGIATVFLDLEHLDKCPEAFLFLGELLGRRERARKLADYARGTLHKIAAITAGIPERDRRTVYYAEGTDGLATERESSVHAELITLAGGRNVHRGKALDNMGMEKISLEQVLIYNPQVIVTQERTFYDLFAQDKRWQAIRAVKDKQVLLIPRNPFNWFDRPPSFMRLLGLKWLTNRFVSATLSRRYRQRDEGILSPVSRRDLERPGRTGDPALMRSLPISLLFLLLSITVVVSLSLGKYPLPPGEVTAFFIHKCFGGTSFDSQRLQLLENLIMEIRFPRIVAAALIGAALAVSGTAYQAMFINSLVSPGLLGVLAGASFGGALGMVVFKSWYAVQIASFLGGVSAVAIALGIAAIYRANSTIILVLGGIISGAFFSALLSTIKYVADPYNQLPAIVYWLMGNMAMADRSMTISAGIPICVGILCLCVMGRYLNILSMGDEEARSLGMNVHLIRICVIGCATLISALTVVMAGIIGWVGLIIPHITRMITGPDNETLLPASALLGAVYLLIVDDISRLAFNFEIPIGIVTALVGIPFFVLVLKNARKGWQ